MSIWCFSDSHLGHSNVIKYCGRPENHSEIILENLKNSLTDGDTFIHLGDICMGRDVYWHERLMAVIPTGVEKILIRGNHDKRSLTWYLGHGWDKVVVSLDLVEPTKNIAVHLSHYPSEKRFGKFNIHGHFHNHPERMEGKIKEYYDSSYHKLMSPELLNYMPLTLVEALDRL